MIRKRWFNWTNYSYLTIVSFDDDGISLEFVDFEEAYTSSESEEEFIRCNRCSEVSIKVESEIRKKFQATKLTDIKIDYNQKIVIVSVEIDEKIKSVKKTLTIPEELNIRAVKYNLNFSKILKDGVEKELEKLNK